MMIGPAQTLVSPGESKGKHWSERPYFVNAEPSANLGK